MNAITNNNGIEMNATDVDSASKILFVRHILMPSLSPQAQNAVYDALCKRYGQNFVKQWMPFTPH